jgi:MFS family permease
MHTAPEDAACRRFLRYYYLTTFCYDFVFAYAIYTVFFSLRGMTVLQISLLLSWWALAAMALEIPTGALADSWRRKNMLALAPIFKSLCFLTWFLAGGSFYLFALGFLLWAAGSTFSSGTSEALLYDTLAHYGRSKDYEKALGRREFYFHIALAISTITGGFIAAYRMDWAVLLSVIPLLLSAVFALRIEESPKMQSAREVPYLHHIRLALREMKSNTVLLYLLVYLWGVSVFGVLEEFDQLYYHLAGLPIYAFGIVAFVGSSLNALGARSAYRLKENTLAIHALPFGSAILLVLVWRYPSVPTIGLLLVSYSLTAPVRVLVESRIQHSITGMSRATVTSVIALLLSVPVLTPIFGLIGRAWNLPAIYLSGSLLLFAVSLWAFAIRDRMKVETPVASTENEIQRQTSLPSRD